MWAVMLYQGGKLVEVLTDGLTLSGATAFAAGHGVSSRGVPVVMPSSQAVGELTELLDLFDAADAETRSEIVCQARHAVSLSAHALELAEDCEGEDEAEVDPQVRALFVGLDHCENGQGVVCESLGGRVANSLKRELFRRGHTAEVYELRLSFSEVRARGRVLNGNVESEPGAKWMIPAAACQFCSDENQQINGGRYARS